jgi:4-amino-4-deoxy-L-arabinose transferase-like glycosyltransferase
VVWALTLLAAVAPSILLLFLIRWAADRIEPGYGTAAAITFGVATIFLIFAAEFFSHAISAMLGFAAFCLLMRERAGPLRTATVAIAGLLAGLAVTFEFQAGLVGVVLFFYAVARSGWLKRAAAYAAGALAGALPALAFNWWTLGSPFKLAYSHAVATIGVTGHSTLGLNSDGFFGITAPRLEAARDLLFAGRGLLVLTPVLVMAVVGIFFMHRKGHRAEAWTIGGVALVYFVYNSGYWQPYGGGTPGPRFLIPCLPFLALGIASAYRRLPATTLALAIPSAIWMLLASVTYPLVGEQGSNLWVDWLRDGQVEHTLLTVLGVHSNWIALAPVLLALAVAIVYAVLATPRAVAERLDVWLAVGAIGLWLVVSAFGPTLAQNPVTPIDGGSISFTVIGAGAVAALAAVAALGYRSSGRRRRARAAIGELALGERTS